MKNTVDYKYLNFKQLSAIDSWSTYAILGKGLVYTNKYPFIEIGKFLTRNKTQVKIQNGVIYKRPTIKINVKGITLRDEVDGINIGTKNQFRIKEGQFLLSKIDARNGAFGVVPKELDNGIITGNFWTFDVDYSRINPIYLTLLTGTKEFQKLSQSASVGTTNRNYLQEKLFLSFKIPLPSLSEQEAIIKAYQVKIQQAQNLEQQAQNLEQEIEKYFLNELGIEKVQMSKTKNKELSFIEYQLLDKWGLDFIGISDKSKSKFPTKRINQICNISSGGTPKRSRKEYFLGNIPWIKTGELKNKIIYDTEEKITNDAINNSSAKLYKKGSLVVAMYGATIGKTAKLGVNATTNQACAVLFDINNELVITDYLWEYLQLEVDNLKKLAYGSAQPNLNAGIISNYKIPLPPKDKQQNIVHYITEIKKQIQLIKEKNTQLKHQAEQEFEQAIFN